MTYLNEFTIHISVVDKYILLLLSVHSLLVHKGNLVVSRNGWLRFEWWNTCENSILAHLELGSWNTHIVKLTSMLAFHTRCTEPGASTICEWLLLHPIVGSQDLSLNIRTNISGTTITTVACCCTKDHSWVPEAQAAGTEEATKADPEVLEAGEDTSAELGHCLSVVLSSKCVYSRESFFFTDSLVSWVYDDTVRERGKIELICTIPTVATNCC